jgi:hypothetical protein
MQRPSADGVEVEFAESGVEPEGDVLLYLFALSNRQNESEVRLHRKKTWRTISFCD